MASIQKRGSSYQITVSMGYSVSGTQIRRTKTWRPPPGMSDRRIRKEVAQEAALFEKQVKSGELLNGSVKLSDFAARWFRDHAEKQLREKTVSEYRALMRRIDPALGHMRLSAIRPHHLMEFYSELSNTARLDTKYMPKAGFGEFIRSMGYTQRSLADAAGIALSTAAQCAHGCAVSETTMKKLKEVIPEAEFLPIKRNNGRLSEKTVSEYHRFLSTMLTAAVRWQIIPYNPCLRVQPPKVHRTEARGLDECEAAELIRCLSAEPLHYRTIVMLALYTGMRRGELCGLDWTDIDFVLGTVRITKSVVYTVSAGVHESGTKTDSSRRTITIPETMLALLREHRLAQLEQSSNVCGKVFTNTTGGLLNPDTVSSWFKSFIKRHELPNIHFHSLRHTAATLLIAAGTDIATVSKRLGHADKSTTLNIYTHAVRSADEAAARKLEEILNSK